MGAGYLGRLHGWRFVLFNAVLGLSHIVVLFNAGSYIALLPHVSGDLGGVLPSFSHLGANRLHGRIGVGLSTRAVPVRTDWRLPSSIGAFIVYSIASYFVRRQPNLAQFVPARIVLRHCWRHHAADRPIHVAQRISQTAKAVALTVWGLFSITPFTIGMPVEATSPTCSGGAFFYLDFVLTLVIVGTLAALLYGRGFHRRYAASTWSGFCCWPCCCWGCKLCSIWATISTGWTRHSPSHRGGVAGRISCFIIWELGSGIRHWTSGCSCIAILSSGSSV